MFSLWLPHSLPPLFVLSAQVLARFDRCLGLELPSMRAVVSLLRSPLMTTTAPSLPSNRLSSKERPTGCINPVVGSHAAAEESSAAATQSVVSASPGYTVGGSSTGSCAAAAAAAAATVTMKMAHPHLPTSDLGASMTAVSASGTTAGSGACTPPVAITCY